MSRGFQSGIATLVCVGLFAASGSLRAQSQESTRIQFQPYALTTFAGKEVQAERGELIVPEDRTTRAGKTIRLGFVKLAHRSQSPGAPIIFLMGGPGIPGTVMARVPAYADLFDRLRDSGDVILLDQRGIGLSLPNLTCPSASLPSTVFETRASLVTALKKNAASCLAQWESRGIKVAAYNTAASADDVEDLRRALGVERLRILAFSYGTHVALSALRRHPDRFSQVVLAGTRGPDHSLKLPSTFDLIFERLSDLAPANRIAGRNLPDLTEVLRSQLRALEQKPIVMRITDRREKRPVTLTIGKQALQILVTNAIGELRLPAILYALYVGDTSLFETMVESVYNGLGAESNLMARAIDCASGASADRLARVRREASWALIGEPAENLVRSPEFCDVFKGIDLGEEFRRPVRSLVPTLFISGSLDAKAPVFEAEELRRGFPNSTHVVVENGFHENLPIAEVQRLVSDFFNGRPVADQPLLAPPPEFLTIDAAKAR